jgi:AcrR family transcriptional regulator
MAATERRQRRRRRIRQSILSAARELVASEGHGNVSLRKIADRIEYSAAAFYSYFRSKDEIFCALAEEDCGVLARRLHDAWQTGADPAARIRRVFWTLYQFSQSNPGFLATVTVHGPAAGTDDLWCRFEYLRGVAAPLEADLSQCIAHGPLTNRLTPAAAIRLLAVGMLGAAAIAPRLIPREHGDAVARSLLDTLLAGLTGEHYCGSAGTHEVQRPAQSASSSPRQMLLKSRK